MTVDELLTLCETARRPSSTTSQFTEATNALWAYAPRLLREQRAEIKRLQDTLMAKGEVKDGASDPDQKQSARAT